jgi:carboxymethylenebutenolidase
MTIRWRPSFVAVAPDLFWRQEPGVDHSVTSEADWQHGLRLYQTYDRDAGIRDIKDTLDAVAKLPEYTGKIADQLFGATEGRLVTAFLRQEISEIHWRIGFSHENCVLFSSIVGTALAGGLRAHLPDE